MSIIGSNVLAGASGSGVSAYEIEQSLRFDGGSKLSRTPSSAGTTTTWTLSYWIKIGDLTAEQAILSANPSAGGYTATWFSAGATSRLKINQYNHPTNVYSKCPTPVYRDPSAWFHVVVVFDSTNATADDRVRFYVNGERIEDFSDDGSSVGGTTNPSQNQASGVNHNAIHYIGSQYDGTYAYAKSYLAEMHLLDGTAVTDAEDFGEYDDNGVWRPIEYTGDSYGTNGFYLKFDPDATNGIGHDHSGNGNDWTASGFTTSGTGTDVMSDTPTNNWCTLNPVGSSATGGFSEGNLNYLNGTTAVWRSALSTFAVSSGKWYFEAKFTTAPASSRAYVGISPADVLWVGKTLQFGSSSVSGSYGYYSDNGKIYLNTTGSTYGASYGLNDLIGVALDLDNGTLHFYKNGTDQGEAASGLTGTWIVGVSSLDRQAVVNFGQRAFEQTPPTGFKALNTANLPAPEIKDGSDYFNTVLWTGTSAEHAITGVGFQPDWSWIKGRTNSTNHVLSDVVRGSTEVLESDSTAAAYTDAQSVKSFDTDGVTLGTSNDVNNSAASYNSYVGWFWKAGGSGSSNTNGSITSTVSVNATAGFSIVAYTGDGNTSSGVTIGHGLGVTPDFIITKMRSSGTDYGWSCWHKDLGGNYGIWLDKTSARNVSMWDGYSSFSSTVFTPPDKDYGNVSGKDYINYCFAEVEGYSKFGSYTGNGNANGPFVYLGFKPALVIWKRTSGSVYHWVMRDSTRDIDNPTQQTLYPSTSGAEQTLTAQDVDFLSNGFKLKTTWDYVNASGEPYIFMAWAENPFGGDGVSPATAR